MRPLAAPVLASLLAATASFGQQTLQGAAALRPDWRRIGNAAIDLDLASPATGPVDKVWFSRDGGRLFVRVPTGQVLETEDFESWKPSSALPSPEDPPAAESAESLPEAGALVREAAGASRLYASGRYVYRSDDGGGTWTNLTRFRRQSIIGDGTLDLAVSPEDPSEVVVANGHGVWRTLDGGLSWTGLNDSLPNLPVRRLLASPSGSGGTRILLDGGEAVEWAPGEEQAWRDVDDPRNDSREAALLAARSRLGGGVTVVALGEIYSYAGAEDGRLWVSSDKGLTWRLSSSPTRGPIQALYVPPSDSSVALAAVGSAAGGGEQPRVLRTINGGLFWDDLSSDLPPGGVHGIAADRTTGVIYVATDRGVFLTLSSLFSATPPADWIPMSENLPTAAAADVMLDPEGNQLFVALEGYGVYAAPAPHRFWDPRAVNAADFSGRPAAPGSLLSVLGARLLKARAGLAEAPVLHASELESQIQVPFEATGRSTRLSLEAARGTIMLELPLLEVSPAIFVDPDGSPLLLDADSGALIDALHPARPNSRVQILATGLGRVQPAWPTGMAAPLETPPAVIAPLRVFVDRNPVEVKRATLAPGYIGFYLVEVQLPALLNRGPAELYVAAEGSESNRVRIYLDPEISSGGRF